MPLFKESKNNFAAAIRSTTDTRIFKFLSFTLKDNFAPTNPPKKEPIAKNPD